MMATWARERVFVTALDVLIGHLTDLRDAQSAQIDDDNGDWPEEASGLQEQIENCDEAMQVCVEARNAMAQLPGNQGELPLVIFRLVQPTEDGDFPEFAKERG